MAQARVTDFFNNRKRGADLNPSKRRKVQLLDTGDSVQEVFPSGLKSPPVSARTRTKAVPNVNVQLDSEALPCISVSQTVEKSVVIKTPAKPKTTLKAKSRSSTASKKVTRSKKVPKETTVNKGDIRDALSLKSIEKTENIELSKSLVISNDDTQVDKVNEVSYGQITASCDDHTVSPPSSPSKRSSKDITQPIQKKRSKNVKCVRKDLVETLEKTKEGTFDFTPYAPTEPAAGKGVSEVEKKVVTGRRLSDEKNPCKSPVFAFKGDNTTKPLSKVSLNSASVKDKLSKCGKLEELKQKLAEFNKAKQELKKKEEPKKLQIKPEPNISEKKVPAYEKFHSLAEPVPPTLSLPFKYKVLSEMFNGVETVVGMLSKRSETCTFSKLRAAVQQIVRRNFEERNLGQIKTVYPEAYILRQERGLPSFGRKQMGYQLTVEPDLEDESPKIHSQKNEKPVLNATRLLQRKNVFHHCLIAIVKQHHKEFLSGLDRPLSIADSKITRWHPRFKLDEVPDIEAAPIPQPPDVKKLNTAKDVLEEARDKLNPRIQRALELVCGEAETQKESPKSSSSTPTKAKSPAASPVKSSKSEPPKSNSALKGVSSTLLDRIRAKEARKTEASLMRTPEATRRLEMLSRMPELARILRTFFVTQKKPALLMDSVIAKFTESYRSSMGFADAEKHFKLMAELTPDFIKLISVKKGMFVKLDMNMDINCVISKLEKIRKQES